MQVELVIIAFSTDRKVSSLAIKLYLFAAVVSVHNGRMAEDNYDCSRRSVMITVRSS